MSRVALSLMSRVCISQLYLSVCEGEQRGHQSLSHLWVNRGSCSHSLKIHPWLLPLVQMEFIMDTSNTLFKTLYFNVLYLLYNQIISISESTSVKGFIGIIFIFLPYLEISVILTQSSKSAPIQGNGGAIQNINQNWNLLFLKYKYLFHIQIIWVVAYSSHCESNEY